MVTQNNLPESKENMANSQCSTSFEHQNNNFNFINLESFLKCWLIIRWAQGSYCCGTDCSEIILKWTSDNPFDGMKVLYNLVIIVGVTVGEKFRFNNITQS